MKKSMINGFKASLAVTLAFVLTILTLTGCQAPAVPNLMAGIKAAEWPAQPDKPDEAFTSALGKFSWQLLQQSAVNEGNILVSPASVYLALAMTLNGADTTTRTAMLQALAAEGLSVADVNKACRDWVTLLTGSGQKSSLAVANSIWYREGFHADKAFLQANADYYAAGARILDFNKPEAVTTINNWVKESTKGLIDKIVEQINPAVVMYLINTIYFKADWKTPFIKNYTKAGNFSAPTGSVTAQFMHRTGTMDYLDKDGATGILLPYANESFAFFAILPAADQSPRQLIAGMSADFLPGMLQSARQQTIDLSLPQFEAKYSDSLKEELSAMGMGIAFQAGNADFSLMETERGKDLYISEVKHKTFFKINEIGTEAAAATLVEISKTSLPDGEIKLAFDRPFLYGIVDRNSGQPVFIGLMEDPSA